MSHVHFCYVCVRVCVSVSEGVSAQSRYVDHSVLRQSITGLQPNTLYTISILALYGNMEGPEISLTQITGIVTLSTNERRVDTCVAHFTRVSFACTVSEVQNKNT